MELTSALAPRRWGESCLSEPQEETLSPKPSARQLFWSGLALATVGVFVQQFLTVVVYLLWGQDAINVAPFRVLMETLWPVVVPLGVAVLAASVIARVIESQSASAPDADMRRPMPPKLTARGVLVAGVILVLAGFLMTSMSNLLFDLSGRSDLSANLARDLWTFVGAPLSAVAAPLGIALVPCAVIVRMLESRVSRPHEASAEELASGPLEA